MTTRQVKSVCPYCGVGCGIVLEVSGNRVVKLTGDKTHPANHGRLCTKGGSAAAALTESGRLEHAFYRTDRYSEPASIQMQDAIRLTASRLRGILDQYGPDALSFYVSGQMSLEAQYLINKLAKGYIRTRHIESNSRLCMASAGTGYKLSLGADGPPGSYEDMDRTDLFFVIGSNMADCHPILFLRMMDRIKAGARLIVVDPRRTATAEKADLYLRINPGTDLALLNGLLHLIVKKGYADQDFIEAYTTGFDSLPAFLEDYPPVKVSAITGIPEEEIVKAAEWIGNSGNSMTLWTMGLNQSTHGTWHTNAICNLHLATGAICRPGSGPFSLTGQPNAMGGREMGYMGPGLPGQRSLLSEADRRFMEDLWRLPHGTLRQESGTGTVSMFEDMEAGEIKACWIICTNPVASVPNRSKVVAGLEAAELVVTQDAFFDTETNKYADIMLPAALWAEGEGVMVNSERSLTLMQKAVEPSGEAMPDWEIIARVACEMGFGDAFTFQSAAEVYAELQGAWNPQTGYDIRGATYERLRTAPVQWPCPPDSANRNPIRYVKAGESGSAANVAEAVPGVEPEGKLEAEPEARIVFPASGGKAVFWTRPYMPPSEMPDEEYPFVLNSGRLQHQWHTLTKTGKIPKLNKLNPGPFIEIHPEDAAQLGLREGDSVEITSRRGRAVLPAVVTDRVSPGSCFAPFHWNDVYGDGLAVNAITSDAVDPLSLQPEVKFGAVSLAKSAVPAAVVSAPAGPPGPPVTMQPIEPEETLKVVSPEMSPALKQSVFSAQLDAFENALYLPALPAFELNRQDTVYLTGFMAGLRADAHFSAAGVPVLPQDAPIEPEKRLWVNGMLAGLFSRTGSSASDKPAQDSRPSSVSSRVPVTILWASQTGNAESAAAGCAEKLQAAGYGVKLTCMSDYKLSALPQERYVLFIASTFGAGDPPDNGARFFEELMADQAPSLHSLQYAILALGDSSYDEFCGFGRKLDKRLSKLGAGRMMDTVLCDTDYEEQADSWTKMAAKIMGEETEVKEYLSPVAATSLSINETVQIKEDIGYNRKHPAAARILRSRLLNREDSAKETRHYAFDISRSGLQYEAGDALGVWPVNCPELVLELLDVLRLNPEAQVEIPDKGGMPLFQALQQHYEIARISPEMLRYIQDAAGSVSLNELLKAENSAELRRWLYGRQLTDLLKEYPSPFSPDSLLKLLKPLQPRLYSISSSPKAYPGEVHITVSTVRYSHNGIQRKGVCSTFLADIATVETEIPVFIQRNSRFRPPANPDTPLIMVGPGTGIAPFRGFLQERRERGARGRNWLFFGEQHKGKDFYFEDELEELQSEGFLHRLVTAFSRDQSEKIYVQQRMLEHGEELWSWISDGAHFYVCGDASQMAQEVDAALRAIIFRHGGMSEDEAGEYLKTMTLDRRYVRDVY
ncbi:molybdopterin-dependent oxidoreductase [Paenibacillus sp. HN-1]|uniref:bifunctional nitrate reductase/sulfite reductase flavoprotein subunit alpha n=1 Tax=Paenibacillus TaxID=44249 RepID=UPI001CA885D2|nr:MULTISPECIES: bifunctional nitrate reductase/sulfite reductase flavoprotein subunit alpha [Paenibacillus]MBY9078072.1 molybdopterin-dependent oxidoreductase [Paenibacillus sp. CGMCC 1.18879]MBY9083813.1 molybdopterin-dependent oxidoreductase [Paenibacillus sinensis]